MLSAVRTTQVYLVVACLVASACGRLGYDALEQTSDVDAGPGGDGPFGSLVLPSCGTTLLLRDTFDDGAASTDWVPFTETGASVAEGGGYLKVSLTGGATAATAGYDSRTAYELRGSQIAVTVARTGGQRTMLEARDFTGHRIQLAVESGELLAVVADGDTADVRARVAYDPAQHRHWRLRDDGTTTSWQVSPDRVAWTTLHTEATPQRSWLVTVRLAAGGQLGTASEAWFDDLNLPSPPPPGFCKASTVTDDFGDGAVAPSWNSWISSGACTGREVDGALVLSFTGEGESWCGIDTRQRVDLRDSAASVEVALSPELTRFSTLFEAVNPDGSRIEMRHDGDLLFVASRSKVSTRTHFTTPYDPVAHRFWRMRDARGVAFWETSADGTTWATQFSEPTPIDLSAVTIDLAAGHWSPGSGQTATVRYGQFNLP